MRLVVALAVAGAVATDVQRVGDMLSSLSASLDDYCYVTRFDRSFSPFDQKQRSFACRLDGTHFFLSRRSPKTISSNRLHSCV